MLGLSTFQYYFNITSYIAPFSKLLSITLLHANVQNGSVTGFGQLAVRSSNPAALSTTRDGQLGPNAPSPSYAAGKQRVSASILVRASEKRPTGHPDLGPSRGTDFTDFHARIHVHDDSVVRREFERRGRRGKGGSPRRQLRSRSSGHGGDVGEFGRQGVDRTQEDSTRWHSWVIRVDCWLWFL